MRLFIFLSVFVGLLLPSGGMACSPRDIPTDSMEPVTVKIANTYFQIPEKYIPFYFFRVPKEVAFISVQGVVLTENEKPVSFFILKNDGENKGTAFNDEIVIRASKGIDVEGYLRTISSQTPPASWEEDSRLAASLVSDSTPCSSLGVIAKNPDYSDVLKGAAHRNQEIRVAAAGALANDSFKDKEGRKELLITLVREDNSPHVRDVAVRSIGKLARSDASLIPVLIDVMLKDDNYFVSYEASNVLPETGAESVLQLVAAIPRSDNSKKQYIGRALARFINNEVSSRNLTSFSQLSDAANIALNGVVEILNSSQDHLTRLSITNPLLNSKRTVASEAYIKALNKIIAEDDPTSIRSAARALAEVGMGAENVSTLVKRLEASTDAGVMTSLMGAIGAFKGQAKEAIPLLAKLTAYGRGTPEEGNTGIVRWSAIVQLQEIGIPTPEAIGALETAVIKEEKNNKAQAINALKRLKEKMK